MSKESYYWWPNNFFCKGEEYNSFWQYFFKDKQRKVLFILGKGFDPRMNLGIKSILKEKNDSLVDCMLLNFDEGDLSPSHEYTEMINHNYLELQDLIGVENITELKIQMLDGVRRIGGRTAANLFKNITSIENYTDIVVDISALPRSIYFPMIIQILNINKSNLSFDNKKRNIHVIVSESSQMDSQIIEQELDEKASYIFSLSGDMEITSKSNLPIIWFPVLGNNKEEHLSRVLELLEASSSYDSFLDLEICPILPFPSKDPRMPDLLISSYKELFSSVGIEARNMLYCDEQNPFDVYHQIMQSGCRYDKTLNILNGCRKVISAMSSKLMSLGALLAAYEGNMAIAFTGAQGYRVNELDIKHATVDLFEIWLDGEPYE